MPSGDPVWVRVDSPNQREAGSLGSGTEDVSLGETVSGLIQVGQLPGFTQAVHGVVASVQEAFAKHRPGTLTVEFGIEINVQTGRVLSVLAEGGGAAHVKVTATWGDKLISGQEVSGEDGLS